MSRRLPNAVLAWSLLLSATGVHGETTDCSAEDLEFWNPSHAESRAPGSTYTFERWLTSRLDESQLLLNEAGLLTLVGNTAAHEAALRCTLQKHAPSGSGPHHLLGAEPISVSCRGGCKDLVQQVAWRLQDRDALWTIVMVQHADHAPLAQINELITKFILNGRCKYEGSAPPFVNVDCKRVLFVLSAGFGRKFLVKPTGCDDKAGLSQYLHSGGDGLLKSITRSGEVLNWLTSSKLSDYHEVSKRLEASMRPVRGDIPCDWVEAFKLTSQADGDGSCKPDAEAATRLAARPDLGPDGPLGRFRGQDPVVKAVNDSIYNVLNLKDSLDGPEVFFFYGWPGSGKSYLPQVIAQAMYGIDLDVPGNTPPYYAFYKMNEKADAKAFGFSGFDCSLKAGGGSELRKYYGKDVSVDSRPVLVFDEIEKYKDSVEVFRDAIDVGGSWEYIVCDKVGDKVEQETVTHSTIGSIIIFTSNCYQDELEGMHAELSKAHAALKRKDPFAFYEMLRAQMGEKIHPANGNNIPCGVSDQAQDPLKSTSFQSRFKHRTFPFLAMSSDDLNAAVENIVKAKRAKMARTASVSLYWTPEYIEHRAEQGSEMRERKTSLLKEITQLHSTAKKECQEKGSDVNGGGHLLLFVRNGKTQKLVRCASGDHVKRSFNDGTRRGEQRHSAGRSHDGPSDGGGASRARDHGAARARGGDKRATRDNTASSDDSATIGDIATDKNTDVNKDLKQLLQKAEAKLMRIAERFSFAERVLMGLAALTMAFMTSGFVYVIGAFALGISTFTTPLASVALGVASFALSFTAAVLLLSSDVAMQILAWVLAFVSRLVWKLVWSTIIGIFCNVPFPWSLLLAFWVIAFLCWLLKCAIRRLSFNAKVLVFLRAEYLFIGWLRGALDDDAIPLSDQAGNLLSMVGPSLQGFVEPVMGWFINFPTAESHAGHVEKARDFYQGKVADMGWCDGQPLPAVLVNALQEGLNSIPSMNGLQILQLATLLLLVFTSWSAYRHCRKKKAIDAWVRANREVRQLLFRREAGCRRERFDLAREVATSFRARLEAAQREINDLREATSQNELDPPVEVGPAA